MEILIILGLILLNGLFSMTEMAMVSSRKIKLETEAKKGNKKAKKALIFIKHPDQFLSTIQIGITLIGILTGIFSGESIQRDLTSFLNQFEIIGNFGKPLATAIIVIIVTYLTLILGELVPKRIGLANPERITKSMVSFMNILNKISYPFIYLLTISTRFIVKLLNIKINDSSITEEEIKAMINQSAQQGEIEMAEQEIIERVFHLGDRNITSLMIHRSEIYWLDINMNREDIYTFIQKNLHSVYPVCDGNIDNIKGFVKTKDLYASSPDKELKEICRPALFVPETNTTYKIMEKFKSNKTNVCFIVDEYGSLQGMITLNNIFEALIGDVLIEDYRDEPEIIKRKDDTYLIDAQMHFYNFLKYFNLENQIESTEKFDTVAGLILNELEHIPKTGEQFNWNNFIFEIIDMDGHRIDKVLIKKQ